MKRKRDLRWGLVFLPFLAAAVMPVGGVQTQAQDKSVPATSNVDRAPYPRILPDHRVIFQTKVPDARKVQVDLGNELIRVNVEDNGKGFSPETLKESASLGLKLIRERAEMLGGSFEVDSASGSGARISFAVPSKM